MQIYLVGGAVRDDLLGLAVTEHDWVVVGATAQTLLDQGYKQVPGDFPVFLHPQSGEEYALARRESKTGQGHQAFAFEAGPDVSLQEDLIRRDLTINAIARDGEGELFDPYNGCVDLQERRLRHVSPAFQEDPLRLLRTARFAAKLAPLGFQVADDTLAMLKKMAASGELATLSAGRIWEETAKALNYACPGRLFEELQRYQALESLFPELAVAAGQGECFARALQYCNQAAEATARPEISWAVLCAALAPEQDGESWLAGLQARLRVPKRYAELAELLVRHYPNCLEDRSAEQRYQRLQAFDALRRKDRYANLVEALGVLSENPRLVSQWKADLQAVLSVDAGRLAASGLRGPELGAALQNERIACLGKIR